MQTALVLAALAATGVGQAQPVPAQKSPDAFAVVSRALGTAAESGRNVWILFDASW